HVNFLTEPEWRMLGACGYLQRTHRQFHWENAGYACFDDFLASLASRKRKTIRREREEALKNGITIDWLTGSDLTESVWDTFLHFEVCYYQAIDYAIRYKLRVEAGAGGEHKISRGYLPMTTYSAHYIIDPNFRRAVDDFLKRERAHVEEEVDELAEAAPFRKG